MWRPGPGARRRPGPSAGVAGPWRRALAGLAVIAALALSACSSSTRPVVCVSGRGPTLDPANAYLLVASTLSEEWVAARRDGGVVEATLPEHGLTGAAPNDLDVRGDRLYTVNSGDNTVSIVDLTTGTAVACIGTGDGTNPWEFFLDPSDPARGWVTTFLTGELLELDLEGYRVVRRRTIGPGLEGLWVTDTQVVVTLTGYLGSFGTFEDGTVVFLDKGSLSETQRLRVPINSQFVFQGGDGRFHVVCTGDFASVSGSVVRVEADGSAVRDTLNLAGAPGRATLGPDGNAYVVGYVGGVQVYDSVAFTLGNPLSTDTGFTSVAVADTTLYAANFEQDVVTVVNLPMGVVTQALPMVGDGPIALALYPSP